MWVYYLIYSFFLLLVYLLHVAPHVLYTDIGDLIGSFFELLEPPAPSAPFGLIHGAALTLAAQIRR